jgi:dTDP-glucose 4,6-dehydratase
MTDSPTYLVTGGAGFIGSHLVERLLREPGARVIVLDKLTYAGNADNLRAVEHAPNYHFERGDIADGALLRALLGAHRPSALFHLAAETHVDRSIDGPRDFLRTNVLGTFELLDATRHWLAAQAPEARARFRFVHVSTDEVYGSLAAPARASEETPYAPNSPYSASKAGGDHLVRSYVHTYGLPAVLTHSTNNYGPRQYPEKLLPLLLTRALRGESLPVYGDGQHQRDWLYVEDHCEGLLRAARRGVPGAVYHFGSGQERTNLAVVRALCELLDRLAPAEKPYHTQLAHVADRPGHDRRYAVSIERAERELAWRPTTTFEDGLERTVAWYLSHRAWSERILAQGGYQGQRLGTLLPSTPPDQESQ